MALGVNNASDPDRLTRDLVVHGERKAMQEYASQGAVHRGSGRGHLLQEFDGSVEVGFEFRTESRALGFIPRKSLRHVRGGPGSKLDDELHPGSGPCSLARTSLPLTFGPSPLSSIP